MEKAGLEWEDSKAVLMLLGLCKQRNWDGYGHISMKLSFLGESRVIYLSLPQHRKKGLVGVHS